MEEEGKINEEERFSSFSSASSISTNAATLISLWIQQAPNS